MVREDELDGMAMDALGRVHEAVRVFNEAYYGDRMDMMNMLKQMMEQGKRAPMKMPSQVQSPAVPPVEPMPPGGEGGMV